MDRGQTHSFGATIIQHSPFTVLEVPGIMEAPTPELICRWIKPLYMSFHDLGSDGTLTELRPEMNYNIALTLLSYFNWRPRIVGAYIVALVGIHELTELIGKLLLRSDVCYAGRGYCLALAKLNSDMSRKYLLEYLDYYLTRIDLWYDQADAMGAIAYLDQVNGTKDLSLFIERWNAFTQNKATWDLNVSASRFADHMARINQRAASTISS